jgi:hypothetical protein
MTSVGDWEEIPDLCIHVRARQVALPYATFRGHLPLDALRTAGAVLCEAVYEDIFGNTYCSVVLAPQKGPISLQTLVYDRVGENYWCNVRETADTVIERSRK